MFTLCVSRGRARCGVRKGGRPAPCPRQCTVAIVAVLGLQRGAPGARPRHMDISQKKLRDRAPGQPLLCTKRETVFAVPDE